jgi:hypothetical protein
MRVIRYRVGVSQKPEDNTRIIIDRHQAERITLSAAVLARHALLLGDA